MRPRLAALARRSRLVATVVVVLAGMVVGVGGFAFVYARGGSYLTDDPGACANCHVMRPQLDAWAKSSHHSVAVCNDCHTPAGLLPKYATKALNGFLHSYAFTTDRFPQNIHIGERNREVAEGACRGCHGQVVEAIDAAGGGAATSCLACHAGVGHAESVALGTVPAGFRSTLHQEAQR